METSCKWNAPIERTKWEGYWKGKCMSLKGRESFFYLETCENIINMVHHLPADLSNLVAHVLLIFECLWVGVSLGSLSEKEGTDCLHLPDEDKKFDMDLGCRKSAKWPCCNAMNMFQRKGVQSRCTHFHCPSPCQPGSRGQSHFGSSHSPSSGMEWESPHWYCGLSPWSCSAFTPHWSPEFYPGPLSTWSFKVSWVPREERSTNLALNLGLYLLTVGPQEVAWLLRAWFLSVKWVEYSSLPGCW